MTPEQQLERVRMCVAEAGYDPADVLGLDPVDGGVLFRDYGDFPRIPQFVAWRAGALAATTRSCWPCSRETGWLKGDAELPPPCGHPVDPFCREDAEVVS